MEQIEERYIKDNLRNLIRRCCLNLNEQTTKEEIEALLPIEQNGIKIWFEEDNLFLLIDNDISFFLTAKDGKINNLQLLKRLMFKFGIYLEGEGEYEQLIFQNEILKLLAK